MLKKKIVTNRSRKLQAEPVLVGPGAPRPPPAAEPRPEPPPLRWRGPQGTRNDPDNFGSAAGGFTQAPGGWAGPKLESVEFPAFDAILPMLGRSYWPMLAMLLLPCTGYAPLLCSAAMLMLYYAGAEY